VKKGQGRRRVWKEHLSVVQRAETMIHGHRGKSIRLRGEQKGWPLGSVEIFGWDMEEAYMGFSHRRFDTYCTNLFGTCGPIGWRRVHCCAC